MPATAIQKRTPARAVTLRMRNDIRDLIDQAARSQGKSRSEFMIDAARWGAKDALLDQPLICVDLKTCTYFLKVLDQRPGEGYDRLMKVKKPREGVKLLSPVLLGEARPSGAHSTAAWTVSTTG